MMPRRPPPPRLPSIPLTGGDTPLPAKATLARVVWVRWDLIDGQPTRRLGPPDFLSLGRGWRDLGYVPEGSPEEAAQRGASSG